MPRLSVIGNCGTAFSFLRELILLPPHPRCRFLRFASAQDRIHPAETISGNLRRRFVQRDRAHADFVAVKMAELIVDLFEIVKIQQDQRIVPFAFQFFQNTGSARSGRRRRSKRQS